MARYFLPQRNELTQEEREKLTGRKIAELNRLQSQQLGSLPRPSGST